MAKTTILILLRGVPGSGKSTLAKKICKNREENGEEIRWFEADQYFVGENGEYSWDPSKLRRAHEVCFLSTKRSLESRINTIVSNTFVKRKELNPYVSLAETLNAKLIIYTCKGQYQNEHEVPQDKVDEMRKKFVNDSELLFYSRCDGSNFKVASTEEEILRSLEEALDDF